MIWEVWEAWAIAAIALFCGLTGLVFVVLTLPGIWLMVAVSALCLWWQPELITWKAVLTLGILALIAEAVEFFASAAGSKKFGGSKRGALGSIVGTILGAIAGTVMIPIPIMGTILGGILGAGLGAMIVERAIVQQTWTDSMKSGGGAAAGRAVSIFVKLGLTLIAGLFFIAAAFV